MVSRAQRHNTAGLRAQCAKLRAAGWDRLELKIRLALPSQAGAEERALLMAIALLRETELSQAEDERSGDEDAEYYWSRW